MNANAKMQAKIMKAAMVLQVIAIIFMVLTLLTLSGCKESQQVEQTPVWGKGDLPPHWIEYFGNDNTARLDFKQSQIIDEVVRRVITLEINQYIPDPNGVK